MRFARNQDINFSDLSDDKGAEKRRHGRIICDGVQCSIGDVLDLSASGMRVKTRYKMPDAGEVFVVTLETVEGTLAVLCRIRWVRRCGMFTREVGLEFFDPGPKSKQVLQELAGRAAYNDGFKAAS
ncbi:hypothetical protein LBMAG48_21050 [Phycisphaerae bacterium]|jgi:hypothetical protein|nr:hypothetical protein LBMAG48_21050 [Phycisphaerae bacterium]